MIPSFFAKETVANWPWFFPRAQINLGLDLRGGAHLLLSMETAEVRKDWLETLRDDARKRLRDAKIAVTGVGISNNAVQVRLAKAEDGDAALKELRPLSRRQRNPRECPRRTRGGIHGSGPELATARCLAEDIARAGGRRALDSHRP